MPRRQGAPSTFVWSTGPSTTAPIRHFLRGGLAGSRALRPSSGTLIRPPSVVPLPGLDRVIAEQAARSHASASVSGSVLSGPDRVAGSPPHRVRATTLRRRRQLSLNVPLGSGTELVEPVRSGRLISVVGNSPTRLIVCDFPMAGRRLIGSVFVACLQPR